MTQKQRDDSNRKDNLEMERRVQAEIDRGRKVLFLELFLKYFQNFSYVCSMFHCFWSTHISGSRRARRAGEEFDAAGGRETQDGSTGARSKLW